MDQVLNAYAKFASTLKFCDLPQLVVDVARDRLIDSVACAIGGAHSTPIAIARSVVAPAPRSGLSGRILGSKQIGSADTVAFLNSCMIRNLDLNDTVQGGHPSDVLGGILAVAPQGGVTGERLITAAVAAYEVIIDLLKGGLREKGWDQGFGISVGCAVGLSNLLGLSEEAARNAIAITAVANTPLRATRSGMLSMWKGAATAHGVRNAVFAAQLAAAGMTGPESPFSGRHGLFEQISGPFDPLPADISKHEFKMPTVYLKYWAVAYSLQPVIWAGIELRKQVQPDDLVSVDVQTYAFSVMESGSEPAKWDPQTQETADHSIPYVLARALIHGVIDEDSFLPASYLDPAIRPLMNKITVHVDDGIEQEVQQGTIHVRLVARDKNGKSCVVNIVNPIGHEKNPLTPKDLAAKFKRLCDSKLGKRRATAALRHWQNIAAATDLKAAFDAIVIKAVRD